MMLFYMFLTVCMHIILHKLNTSVRLMCLAFSSVFNTIQRHLLADKLLEMKISVPSLLWIIDYLTSVCEDWC